MTRDSSDKPIRPDNTDAMIGALIDPFTRTVSPYIYNGDWREISTALDCRHFDVARFAPGVEDVVYIDDEGLFSRGDEQAFFAIDGYPEPLAGYGLVLGTNSDGDTIAPAHTVAEIKAMVHWLDAMHDPQTGQLKLVMQTKP